MKMRDCPSECGTVDTYVFTTHVNFRLVLIGVDELSCLKKLKFCLSVAILEAYLHNLFMYVDFLKFQYI